ncbi:hypothetical protein LJC59_00950 [Desulfovibrio sp. OttesenSCG-928-A18]|nr:hypothetical protein [Desulfovibrio sp. OttesenSCG-928-A18]
MTAASKKDRDRLYVAVAGLAKRANVYPGTIWSGLKKHLGVVRMSDITAAHIPAALSYLSGLTENISGNLSDTDFLKKMRAAESEDVKLRLVKMAIARFHLARPELVQELCAAIDEATSGKE